jgi:tetratricopeptide (TPR) repeat protein
MYRNALQKDQRYGPAYYHLALTDLKLNRIPNALGELRRAIELIPKDQPEHLESEVRLAEIYLAFTRDSQYMLEVEGIVKELLQHDPNSFDGHRLTGDLDFVRAQSSLQAGHPEQTGQLLSGAIAEYRKAISIKKPGPALMMQLARALSSDRQFPEAEQIYRQLINNDKTFLQAYNELYRVYLQQNNTAEAEQTLKTGAANKSQANQLSGGSGQPLLRLATPRPNGGDTQSNQGTRQGFRPRVPGGGRFLFSQRGPGGGAQPVQRGHDRGP